MTEGSPTFSDRQDALRAMMRVTMFDEYGRCLHCGFWHPDGGIGTACAEHEAQYDGQCGCVFKRLPKPDKGKDGLWHAPGILPPDEMAKPRDETEFWNRQREFTYGPIEDPVLRRSIWSAFGSLCRNLTNAIRSRLQ